MKDVVFTVDKTNTHVLKIKTGETVIFEYRDAFNHVIKNQEDFLVNFNLNRINHVTISVFTNKFLFLVFHDSG